MNPNMWHGFIIILFNIPTECFMQFDNVDNLSRKLKQRYIFLNLGLKMGALPFKSLKHSVQQFFYTFCGAE